MHQSCSVLPVCGYWIRYITGSVTCHMEKTNPLTVGNFLSSVPEVFCAPELLCVSWLRLLDQIHSRISYMPHGEDQSTHSGKLLPIGTKGILCTRVALCFPILVIETDTY